MRLSSCTKYHVLGDWSHRHASLESRQDLLRLQRIYDGSYTPMCFSTQLGGSRASVRYYYTPKPFQWCLEVVSEKHNSVAFADAERRKTGSSRKSRTEPRRDAKQWAGPGIHLYRELSADHRKLTLAPVPKQKVGHGKQGCGAGGANEGQWLTNIYLGS